MWTVGTPDQSKRRSAIQWSRAAWLFGIFPRRNLRHVYNDFERRPLGRVREIRRCLNESRANRIAKISRAGADCRPDYVVVLQEFTYHDLRARAPKRLRALVLLVDHRADSVTSFKKMLDCMLTGPTGRADYQELLRAHHSSPEWMVEAA